MGDRESRANKKSNNHGLSLVELLIAVTILAIIIVPLLHAFVSSARLNLKSQRTMKSTMIAETIMEEFKELSVEELVMLYAPSQSSVSENGIIYTFSLDSADFSEQETDAYRATVVLDPSKYIADFSNLGIPIMGYNKAVVADVSPITMEHSAVYAASPTYDQSVYKIFEERSRAANNIDPTSVSCNAAFFEEKLNRTIQVELSKGANVVDDQGNTIPLARVEITVEYTYNDNASTKALLPTDLKYTVKRKLFENTTTKKALDSVFIIYTPRYKACNPALGAGAKQDTITIRNLSQLETTVSVIRQETDQDATYLPTYLSQKKASITIIEAPVWSGSYTVDTPGAIGLRTNLITTNASNSSTREFALTYQNASGTQRVTGDTAAGIVTLRTAEGKSMDGSAVKSRIFDINVTIFHESDLIKPIATIDGTKIDQ